MDNRVHHFHFANERERVLILVWNAGQPFLIDGRSKLLSIRDVDRSYAKQDLLKWGAINQVRCVGFEGDSRPPRASFHTAEVTWAVVG
jgi:hypothetical protein